jgi:chemotaxis protein CheD
MMERKADCDTEVPSPSRPLVGRRPDEGISLTSHVVGGDAVVGVGEFRVVAQPERLMCIGLGSCVGIAIYDLGAQIGGLIHAMLPRYEEGRDKTNASKYVDSSVMLMVDELLEMGATRPALRAKMVGGAQMFSFISSDTLNIGLRNSQVAREVLKKESIPLLAEDVGGTKGRTIVFSSSDGSVRISKGGENSQI